MYLRIAYVTSHVRNVGNVCRGRESGKVAGIRHTLYGSSKQKCDQIARKQKRKREVREDESG